MHSPTTTYVCAGILALFAGTAQAEVFRSAPLNGGKFSLGMEPEIAFNGDTDASFFLHGGFGVGRGYGLHVKIGFGRSQFNDDDVYFGGMLDIPLVRDGRGYPGLYVAVGGSTLGEGAIDSHLIVHNDFGRVTLYGGIDDAVVFVDNPSGNDVAFPVEVVFGAEFTVSGPFHLLLEGGIDLHDSANFISGGMKFYFP